MKILEIIKQINRGDIQAPKRLYVSSYDLLYTITKRYVICETLAKDVLQNTYLKIFENIAKSKFENEVMAFAWMKRICVNESLNIIRTKKNWDKLQFTSKVSVTNNNNSLRQEEIYNLILKLPVQQRTVFNLFAIEGYSHKEISKKMGISLSNSATLLARARKNLSNHLIKDMSHESTRS